VQEERLKWAVRELKEAFERPKNRKEQKTLAGNDKNGDVSRA
jgi:hypothetical protein